MTAFEKILENGIVSKRTKRIATITGIATVAMLISLADDKGVFGKTVPAVSDTSNTDVSSVLDKAEEITEAFKASTGEVTEGVENVVDEI